MLLVCTAIASFAIVIVPALVAPLQRFRVALAAFGCGAVFAIYVASSGGFWPPFVVSAAGGSAGLWVAASQLKPSGIAM
ncbi:MAG TPA: hypothetical protein VFO58_24000 [Vicinamibacterales bacterium]|nr:hypothetical protein [Vicinamibacterales bacterium]